jgi:glycosyltransferase involved in cell wall biosynthesis
MLTTFFGAHSFGGDAAFVDRLSRTLARHGHEVHIIHCRDAFEISRGGQSPRPYEPDPAVQTHTLASPVSILSPLATHQTGRPFFKARAIRDLVRRIGPDVVHFHNLSLIGGPGLLEMPVPGAAKLMTAHEHWLVCPLSVLWKQDSALCERPECTSCCLQARRPPQLWRKSGLMNRALNALDALIGPSLSTIHEHRRRGVTRRMVHLPYFLPNDYVTSPEPPRSERPYVVSAGRLEKNKGFQDVIEAMRTLSSIDLRIAGAGGFEPALREQARGLANVQFEGRLDGPELASLFRGARAVVVPSLVYETFGYVVLEAFAEGTPVIVRDLGALPELVDESGGGLTFDTLDNLRAAISRLATDAELAAELGANGLRARQSLWSEAAHLESYFDLIDQTRRSRRIRFDVAHALAGPSDRSRAREAVQFEPSGSHGTNPEARRSSLRTSRPNVRRSNFEV